MKITFILPVTSQPRYWKRIKSLERLGCNNKVLAFERKYISININNKDYIIIGKLEHEKYYKRILPFAKSFITIKNNIKYADIIYVFGLDMLLLGWAARLFIKKKNEIIYEVGDIRSVLIGNNIQSIFLRWLERYLMKFIGLLIVTSEAYVTEYFKKIQGIKNIKYQVIENKVDSRVIDKLLLKKYIKKRDVLTIGYFGLLNCKRSWEILKNVAIQGGKRIEIRVRGLVMTPKDLTKEIEKISNITYYGPYIAPDELPIIYGMVDIIWACYPFNENKVGNWMWARTNRFYEACFFKKPIIAQKGTEDCKVVEKLQIGLCLDLSNIQKATEQLLSINDNQIIKWETNMKSIPEGIYVYKFEHKLLYKNLMELKKTQ